MFDLSLVVLLLIHLGLFIKAVDYPVNVVEGFQSVFKQFNGLWLVKDYEAVPSLVEGACDHFIQDHLTQLLQNPLHWKPDAFCDIINLDLGVGLDDFLEVILE